MEARRAAAASGMTATAPAEPKALKQLELPLKPELPKEEKISDEDVLTPPVAAPEGVDLF
jgi:hypothetical protein